MDYQWLNSFNVLVGSVLCYIASKEVLVLALVCLESRPYMMWNMYLVSILVFYSLIQTMTVTYWLRKWICSILSVRSKVNLSLIIVWHLIYEFFINIYKCPWLWTLSLCNTVMENFVACIFTSISNFSWYLLD